MPVGGKQSAGAEYDNDAEFKVADSPYIADAMTDLHRRDRESSQRYADAIADAKDATRQAPANHRGPQVEPAPYRTITEAQLAGKTRDAVDKKYVHDPELNAPIPEMRKPTKAKFPSVPTVISTKLTPVGAEHTKFSECMDSRFARWQVEYEAKSAKSRAANSQSSSAWY